MLFRKIIILGFCFFLVGCSTAKQPTALNNLQIRVAHLENKLEERTGEVDQLKYEINSLTSQLNNIEEYQLDSPAEEYLPVENTAIKTPVRKSSEKIVRVNVATKIVQEALKYAGYYKGTVDGKIGNMTKQAIKAFQKDHGLTADGIIGSKTWDALKDYLE